MRDLSALVPLRPGLRSVPQSAHHAAHARTLAQQTASGPGALVRPFRASSLNCMGLRCT